MKTITFVSHYNKEEMNVRMSGEKANELLNNKRYEPIELYRMDADRVAYGQEPKYFGKSQIKRLNDYLTGAEYWDNVVING